jgi:hypothetical protein
MALLDCEGIWFGLVGAFLCVVVVVMVLVQ